MNRMSRRPSPSTVLLPAFIAGILLSERLSLPSPSALLGAALLLVVLGIASVARGSPWPLVACLLAAALCRGADARGVFGEVGVALSEGLPLDRVRTNKEMLDILKRDIGWADCLIMAAAVSDYEPSTAASVKGHSPRLKLALKKSADILKALSSRKGNKIFAGFSLEDRNGLDRSRKKMKDKGVDLIVLNSFRTVGGDFSDAQVLEDRGRVHKFEASDKWTAANRILDICRSRLKGKGPEPGKRRIR